MEVYEGTVPRPENDGAETSSRNSSQIKPMPGQLKQGIVDVSDHFVRASGFNLQQAYRRGGEVK